MKNLVVQSEQWYYYDPLTSLKTNVNNSDNDSNHVPTVEDDVTMNVGGNDNGAVVVGVVCVKGRISGGAGSLDNHDTNYVVDHDDDDDHHYDLNVNHNNLPTYNNNNDNNNTKNKGFRDIDHTGLGCDRIVLTRDGQVQRIVNSGSSRVGGRSIRKTLTKTNMATGERQVPNNNKNHKEGGFNHHSTSSGDFFHDATATSERKRENITLPLSRPALSSSVQWKSNLNEVISTVVPDEDDSINVKTTLCKSDGRWFDITLLPNRNNTCCCLNYNGTIVSVDTDHGHTELVGEFENGIIAASWNPSRDVLVLITSVLNTENDEDFDNIEDNNQVSSTITTYMMLTMNSHFEVMNEVSMEPIDICSGSTSTSNDNGVSICWNSSGTRIAVSSPDVVNASSSSVLFRRKIRIYDSTSLELLSIGRNEDGSGTLLSNLHEQQHQSTSMLSSSSSSSMLAWANSNTSNLLATVQRKGLKTILVSFLEPNGLKHGQFIVRCNNKCGTTTTTTATANIDSSLSSDESSNVSPEKKTTKTTTTTTTVNAAVTAIDWNPIECDLLCVTLVERTTITTSTSNATETKGPTSSIATSTSIQATTGASRTTTLVTTKVQLYHRSNYHWYMKHEIRFSNTTYSSTISSGSTVGGTDEVAAPVPSRAMFIERNRLAVFFFAQHDPTVSLTPKLQQQHYWIEYTFLWNVSNVAPIPLTMTMPSPSCISATSARPASMDMMSYVIDGNIVQMTNLHQSIVPPPMSGSSIMIPDTTGTSTWMISCLNGTGVGGGPVAVNSIALIHYGCFNSNGTNVSNKNDNQEVEINNIHSSHSAEQPQNNEIPCAVLLLSDNTIVVLGIDVNVGIDGGSSSSSKSQNRAYPSILGVYRMPSSDEFDIGSNYCTMLRHTCVVRKSSSRSLSIVGCVAARTLTDGLAVDIFVVIDISLQTQQHQQNPNTTNSINDNNNHHTGVEAVVSSTTILDGKVLTITPWLDASYGVLLQLDDGTLLEYDHENATIQPSSIEPLLEPCPWITCIKNAMNFSIDDESGENGNIHVHGNANQSNMDNDDYYYRHEHTDDTSTRRSMIIGLSSHGRLFCHDVVLSDAVTSFFVSLDHEYVCFTTTTTSSSSGGRSSSRGVVRFIPLAELCSFDPLQGSEENIAILNGYEPRSIERNSRLVAVLGSNQPTCVLQMPRGNLEAIYPRALVLRYVVTAISDNQYRDAFEMMRRHKVDLNLIVDLDPYHFIGDISDLKNHDDYADDCYEAISLDRRRSGCIMFLEQVVTIDHLNLFISSLQDFDCTERRYHIPRWFRRRRSTTTTAFKDSSEKFDFTRKTNMICQKLRSIMIRAERDKNMQGRSIKDGYYLLPILSTFAKEQPPQLGDALKLIQENALRGTRSSNQSNRNRSNGNNNGSSKKSPLFSEGAQSSIQYLAFLADYELLFQTALGLYEYDLARAVARNSQMDPKVYLPLLKRYKSLPPSYGRYEVDIRLKRFELALRNLFQSYVDGEEWKASIDTAGTSGTGDAILNRDAFGNGDVGDGTLNCAEGKCCDFLSCMELIEAHKLHRVGLELFNQDSIQRRQIMTSLGDNLLDQQKKPAMALSIYLATDPVPIDRALKAARESKDWATFFSLLDTDQSTQSMLAKQIAEQIAAGNATEALRDSARIVLDYTDDVDCAVDYLIQAEAWGEGKRICLWKSRQDLVSKVIEATVSFAQTTISDLDERAEIFIESSKRYTEVLRIRKDAIASGEGNYGELYEDPQDSGSLFSAASNASNVSMRSTASTGSVGSLSSVISVKTSNSFSIAGTDVSLRHKSKYNQIGKNTNTGNNSEKKGNRKRNKKGTGRSKIRPGSEQELDGLVQTLLSCGTIESKSCITIGNTIVFLMQNQHILLAQELYDKYMWFQKTIDVSQDQKRRSDDDGPLAIEQRIVHSVEEKMNKLECPKLSDSVCELLSYFPNRNLDQGEKE